MIGALDPKRREATVIGGGIAGLLAAHALDRAGYQVTLLEADARAGGLLETRGTPFGPAERAAHSCLASPAFKELCRDLDVELLPVREDSRARFIWRGGKLRIFPLGPSEAMAMAARALTARAPAMAPRERGDSAPETVEDWGRRHLGQAAVDYLFNPMLRGIYAARPSELAMSAVFPALRPAPGGTLAGSLLFPREKRRASGPMSAPRHGMGSLVQALERRLEARLGSRFRKGQAVTVLPDAPNVVLCVPADAAANLLAGADPALSASLAAVRYAPLVSITAFVRRRDFPGGVPRGVGALIPERETPPELDGVLGVLFNSSTFAGRVSDENEYASFTVMIGGTSAPAAPDLTDSRLGELATGALARLTGSAAEPTHLEIFRWPRAIPLHDARLLETWQAARAGWCATPGRLLFGNHAGQVSLRGMTESAAKLGNPI